MFEACYYCKSKTYEPRNSAVQALASLFVTYLTRQTRNNKLSQNHNSLIFITNPLQTYSWTVISEGNRIIETPNEGLIGQCCVRGDL